VTSFSIRVDPPITQVSVTLSKSQSDLLSHLLKFHQNTVMYIFKLLPLFMAAVASTGFTVPNSQADGVYQVTYDVEGLPVHTFLHGPITATEPRSLKPAVAKKRSTLKARQADRLSCGNDQLNHGNTDEAVQALMGQCAPTAIGGNRDFYSIAGSVVAYICNYNGAAVACSRDETWDSLQKVSVFCGAYWSGWRNINNNGKNIQIGQEPKSAKFCGRGP
jgi:hypothetical protein